jgi:hypothetical protein
LGAVPNGADEADVEGAVGAEVVTTTETGAGSPGRGFEVEPPAAGASCGGSAASAGAICADAADDRAALARSRRRAVLTMSTTPTSPAAIDTPSTAAATARRRLESSTTRGGYSMAAEPSVELVELGDSSKPIGPDEAAGPCVAATPRAA